MFPLDRLLVVTSTVFMEPITALLVSYTNMLQKESHKKWLNTVAKNWLTNHVTKTLVTRLSKSATEAQRKAFSFNDLFTAKINPDTGNLLKTICKYLNTQPEFSDPSRHSFEDVSIKCNTWYVVTNIKKTLNPFLTKLQNTKHRTWLIQVVTPKLKIDPSISPMLYNIIDHICDFLNSPRSMYINLSRLTFDQAEQEADKWVQELHKNVDTNEEPNHAGLKTVFSTKSGVRVVEILPNELGRKSAAREGVLLDHCVNETCDVIWRDRGHIYSVRTPNNIPVATLEEHSGDIVQLKGYDNGIIDSKYWKIIMQFLRDYELNLQKDGENIGLIRYRNSYYIVEKLLKQLGDNNQAINRLIQEREFRALFTLLDKNLLQPPPSLYINDDVSLNYMDITKLPDNLTVTRALNLEGCKKLSKLPKCLTVGSLMINRCKNIVKIPPDLQTSWLFCGNSGITSKSQIPSTAKIGQLYLTAT